MSTFTKKKLSGSTDGRGIKVTTTVSSGASTIHTAVSGTGSNFDEIWLFAYNGDTADQVLTIEFGGTTVPDDNIVLTLPWHSGLQLVVPGLILQNSSVVTAFASAANVIVITGFVNSIGA